MEISVRSGSDEPVVEVAANERHEGPAGRMNPADRQPSDNLGNLRVIARQNIELQLGGGLDGEAGVLPAKPCRLRLAAAIDAEQNQWRRATRGRCGMVRFGSHDGVSWNQKGTRQGSLGFMGYGLRGSGLDRHPSRIGRNNGRNSSDNELHNQITTTYSCCKDSVKSLN
jgi:hypothetical protein